MSEFLRDTAGQAVGLTAIDIDGEPVVSGLAVHVRVDGGARVAGAGTLAHMGGGSWDYVFAQAETDGDRISLDWSGADVVPGTLTIYPTPKRLRDLQDLSAGDAGLAALDALAAYEAATQADLDAAVSAIEQHGDGAWATGSLTPAAIWAYALPGDPAAGSAAAALVAAGNAGDPWAALLPGSYLPGQAGYLFDVIATRTQWITPGSVRLVSPLLEGGRHLVLIRGDSYGTAGAGWPAIDWTPPAEQGADAAWPDLTGATGTFTARRASDDQEEISLPVAIVNPAGPGKVIRLTLDAADTLGLGASVLPKDRKFDIQLTLASGAVWTPVLAGGPLRSGGLTVIEDQTRSAE